jgi:hypothetical protein
MGIVRGERIIANRRTSAAMLEGLLSPFLAQEIAGSATPA